MSIDSGWAFLVARGTRKGYRAVLAPDFLVRNRRHILLAERIGGTASNGPTSTERISDEVFGDLTVTYRVEPAAASELGGSLQDGQDVLLDQHGRPLELLYGVVTTAPVSAGGHDMARARAEATDSYRLFLAHEEAADVQPSASFPLREAVPVPAGPQTPPTQAIAHPTEPPPTTVPPVTSPVRAVPAGGRRPRAPHLPRYLPALLVGLLLLLLVVSVVKLGPLFGEDTADTVNVQVQDLSERAGSDAPFCSDVAGRITVDRSTSVEYQWKVDDQPAAPPRPHRFDGPDKLTVRGPDGFPPGDGRAHDGPTTRRTYQLVVTDSDRHERGGDIKDIKIECVSGGG
jgi:hypothetical protein